MEGFAIYGVIRPGLFTTQSSFFEDYCYVEMKKAGRKQFPVVKGYKNLEHFRERIDPFFLGRKKHDVSNELPVLTTREIVCELSRMEDSKYEEALSGILELGDGEIKEFEEHKALVSLGYCQQVANSMHLLKFQEGGRPTGCSSKEQGLVDLLTGELDDEKVIVYTRFASHVERLQAILKKEGIQSVRITGKESDVERRKNQKAFQDLNSKVKVVFITAAGTEAINLQAAAAMIFFDMPWSWGDYIQCLGRMVRIGSPHKGVLAFHLMAKRPKGTTAAGKTIDHHVLSLLRKKKSFIDKILGESAKGTLKFEKEEGTTLQQLVKSMQGKGERTRLDRVAEDDSV
jgi:SNF2 family DNA or RNA helicase